MKRISDLNIPYELCKNYDLLWELVCKDQRIAAFVDSHKGDRKAIANIYKSPWAVIIGTQGVGYGGYSNTKEEFLQNCKAINLEFIPPSLNLKRLHEVNPQNPDSTT